MGTKDFEDEKHQMSSRAPLLTLRWDWRQSLFKGRTWAGFSLTLCQFSNRCSHSNYTALHLCTKHRPLKRRKPQYKCYRNNSDVAAWPTGHVKPKSKGVKVNTLEVNRAQHIMNYRTSHLIEQMHVPKSTTIQRIILPKFIMEK